MLPAGASVGTSRPCAARRASRASRARRRSGFPPHRRFSRHKRRIRALNSTSIGGRPTRPRDRKRHQLRHAARCHRRTVAGRTTITVSRRERVRVARVAISQRSSRRSRRRGDERRSTMSWWRSRRFSAATTARGAKSLTKAASTLRRRSSTERSSTPYRCRSSRVAPVRRRLARAVSAAHRSRIEFLRRTHGRGRRRIGAARLS
jgi:hypothetical protein